MYTIRHDRKANMSLWGVPFQHDVCLGYLDSTYIGRTGRRIGCMEMFKDQLLTLFEYFKLIYFITFIDRYYQNPNLLCKKLINWGSLTLQRIYESLEVEFYSFWNQPFACLDSKVNDWIFFILCIGEHGNLCFDTNFIKFGQLVITLLYNTPLGPQLFVPNIYTLKYLHSHYSFLRWTILVDITFITVWIQSFLIASALVHSGYLNYEYSW